MASKREWELDPHKGEYNLSQAGLVDMQPEPLQVNRLLRTTWASMEDLAGQRGLTVEWSLDGHDTLMADLSLISLVIQNIVGNAVSHADDGGRVKIETSFNGSAPFLRVSNSGSTLAPESLDHVFERFWRGDRSRSSGRGHSGLGLTLVKRAVTMLGGTVTAASEADGEFVITITIPPVDPDSHRPLM